MIHFCHANVDFLKPCLRLEDIGKDCFRFLVEGPAFDVQAVLREIADRDELRLFYISAFSRDFSEEDLEERGFPCAVGADKPDAVVRTNPERRLFEEVPASELK